MTDDFAIRLPHPPRNIGDPALALLGLSVGIDTVTKELVRDVLGKRSIVERRCLRDLNIEWG